MLLDQIQALSPCGVDESVHPPLRYSHRSFLCNKLSQPERLSLSQRHSIWLRSGKFAGYTIRSITSPAKRLSRSLSTSDPMLHTALTTIGIIRARCYASVNSSIAHPPPPPPGNPRAFALFFSLS